MHRRTFIGTTLAASVAIFGGVRPAGAESAPAAPLPKRKRKHCAPSYVWPVSACANVLRLIERRAFSALIPEHEVSHVSCQLLPRWRWHATAALSPPLGAAPASGGLLDEMARWRLA